MRWLSILLVTVALAGCAESGPQLRGVEETWTKSQIPADVSGQASVRNLDCNDHGIVDIEVSDYTNGSVTVRILDGGGYTVGFVEAKSPGDFPAHDEIVGSPGTWTVEVRRSLEMDAQITVTFRC